MTTLRVNWVGDRLIVEGPVTGKRYEYIPAKQNGFLDVLEADVSGLLTKVVKEGCGCSKAEQGGGSNVQVKVYPMFER